MPLYMFQNKCEPNIFLLQIACLSSADNQYSYAASGVYDYINYIVFTPLPRWRYLNTKENSKKLVVREI